MGSRNLPLTELIPRENCSSFKCSCPLAHRGGGAAWIGGELITCGCWSPLCQGCWARGSWDVLKPSECRISRGSGSILSLLGTCKRRPAVGRLPGLTREHPEVQPGERAKAELPWTYHTQNQQHTKHNCYFCRAFCPVEFTGCFNILTILTFCHGPRMSPPIVTLLSLLFLLAD